MSDTLFPISQLLTMPDAERHPLIVENDDWDKIITPALIQLGKGIDNKAVDLNSYAGMKVLRLMFESIYVMGYRSGQKDTRDE